MMKFAIYELWIKGSKIRKEIEKKYYNRFWDLYYSRTNRAIKKTMDVPNMRLNELVRLHLSPDRFDKKPLYPSYRKVGEMQ